MSTPNPISKHLQVAAPAEMMQRDSPLLQGLTAAGFAIDNGPDGSGLWMKYLSQGGGYYIDVGALQLIADKRIMINQGQEIKDIKARSIVLEDDPELEADEIVFATGYQNMRETARKVFRDELAERVNLFGGFDDEGETRGMWRRSGPPGFSFFGGVWRFVGFNRGCWLCRLRLLRLDSRKLDMSLLLLCDDVCSRRKSIEIYWDLLQLVYQR